MRRVRLRRVNCEMSAFSTVRQPLRCFSQHMSMYLAMDFLSSQSSTTPVFVLFRIMDMAPSGWPIPSTGLHEARYSNSFPGSTALYSGSFLNGRISSDAFLCSSIALA